MKTKICGITNLEDARLAIESGAWALGFNFYGPSPRYIELQRAKEIINALRALPKNIVIVGLFIDQSIKELQEIMDELKLDLAQVYQDYDCSAEAKQSMIYVIHPFTLSDVPPLDILKQYAYILIDTPRGQNDLYGGTGKLANWDVARELSKNVKLLLGGGLNIANVRDAIQRVQPYGVDVCSGIERSRGIKDPLILQEFLNLSST